jgi:hypothetical protein
MNTTKHRFYLNKTVSKINVLIALLMLVNFSCSAQESVSTKSLFDGETLEGWQAVSENNQHFWSVVDGVITGGDGIENIPVNTYLRSLESYEDFEFRCLFRITGDHDKGLINSGIQYRSQIEHGKIIGYQADIGKGYWGDIYDEHRRAKLTGGDLSTLKYILNKEGWNSYIIRCKGNKHELYINGVKTNEYIEKDMNIPSKGVFGIQLHSGGNAKIEFKNITINSL